MTMGNIDSHVHNRGITQPRREKTDKEKHIDITADLLEAKKEAAYWAEEVSRLRKEYNQLDVKLYGPKDERYRRPETIQPGENDAQRERSSASESQERSGRLLIEDGRGRSESDNE